MPQYKKHAKENCAFSRLQHCNHAMPINKLGACLEGNGGGWYLQCWPQDARCSSASTGAAALSASASPAGRMFPACAACHLAPAAAVGIVLICAGVALGLHCACGKVTLHRPLTGAPPPPWPPFWAPKQQIYGSTELQLRCMRHLYQQQSAAISRYCDASGGLHGVYTLDACRRTSMFRHC